MNFFKSILSDDQDPLESENGHESDPDSLINPPHDENNPNDVDGGWSFGGLIQTLAMQSESVIEIYRKDLEEFGSGLKKETKLFRETASRAVKELPASLEAAHGALDGMLKSTANIISKESLGLSSDGDPETPGTNRSSNSGRYSRFEAQLSTIQNDLNTYCGEPEDVEDYRTWKSGFELENYRDEIDSLIGGNGNLGGVYKRVVPSGVDRETFWCRYFYRVDKLKQQESVRANLVRRAISVDDGEELSWDVDDDDDEGSDQNMKGGYGKGDNVASDGNPNPVENNAPRDEGNIGDDEKNVVVESSKMSCVDVSSGEKEEKPQTRDEKEKYEEESGKDNNDEKVMVEEKGESGGKSDAKKVSRKVVMVDEEDLERDEIEEGGSGDEKRNRAENHGGSPNKDDLQKQLNAAGDDDNYLNWDIEDDDEPMKS